MNVDGFSLRQKSDEGEIAFWTEVPHVIDLPDGRSVTCAPVNWDDAAYHIVAASKTVADPSPASRQLVSVGLVRLAGVPPISVLENIGLGSASRIAKGRYRVTFDTPCDGGNYTAFPAVEDPAVRIARITSKTAAFLEMKVTDDAAVAQDATVVSVKVERVVSP